jgi:hypothetical protein
MKRKILSIKEDMKRYGREGKKRKKKEKEKGLISNG